MNIYVKRYLRIPPYIVSTKIEFIFVYLSVYNICLYHETLICYWKHRYTSLISYNPNEIYLLLRNVKFLQKFQSALISLNSPLLNAEKRDRENLFRDLKFSGHRLIIIDLQLISKVNAYREHSGSHECQWQRGIFKRIPLPANQKDAYASK